MFDLVSRVQNLQFNKAVENRVRTSLTYAIKRQSENSSKTKKFVGYRGYAVKWKSNSEQIIRNKTYYRINQISE